MEVVFGSDNVRQAGQLVDGTCMRQFFVPSAPELVSVCVLLTCRSKEEPGFVYLDVVDVVSRRVLGTSTMPVEELEPEGWCWFEARAEMETARRHELVLRTLNCRAGMGPLAHCGDASKGEYFFVGSKLARGAELSCRMAYEEV
jgi:hypothetical protein